MITVAIKPREAGVFTYPKMGLSAKHKAIGTAVVIRSRTKAAEMLAALDAGSDALDRMGLDSTELLNGMGRDGLSSFLVGVEMWIASVEEVTIPAGTDPMAADQVYLLMAAAPDLFLAWDTYAHRRMVSASEGNVFTLSPNGSMAGAESSAGDAVH